LSKKSIVILIAILFISVFAIYGIVKGLTVGQMTYIEIDKSDDNLGITKSDKLLEAIEREKAFKENQVQQTSDTTEVDKEVEITEPELFQILLLGLDSRSKNDKGSRSDAIMLVTIDFKKKEIRLGSFVRDLQVEINGRKDKITHAYAYGGGEETLRTINQNFDLEVRDFAVVNMFNLREIIDIIGGLDIEITKAEMQEINYRVKEIADVERRTDYKFLTESGFQHLNGEQVVAYGRIRNTAGGDFARTDRQREVITLIIEKMRGKNFLELLGISNKLFPLVGTTLTTNEIETVLLKAISNGIDYKILSTRFPSDELVKSDMSTGVYYLKITDMESCIKEIHDFIYGSTNESDND